MSKARITYRFAPPARQAEPKAFPAIRDPLRKSDEPAGGESERKDLHRRNASRALAPYPYDYGSWSDPNEADELERMIRGEARSAAAAANEIAGAESGYAPPPQTERTAIRGTHREKRDDAGPSWWKVVLSVVGAVATGLLFGTMILYMFDGDKTSGPADASMAQGTADPTETGAAKPGTDAAVEEAESAVSSVDLPERRMYLLQNGVFETLEGARTLANEMTSKGMAATIEEGERFYVYSGVTSDRDAALRTALKLQAAGIDVYVKPFDIPSVRSVLWSPDQPAEPLGRYIEVGSGLIRMIGDVTLVHLEDNGTVAVEASTLEALTGEHFRMSEASAAAEQGLPATALPMLARMDDAARNALLAIEAYGAHPDPAYLWSAQSALMDYVIAEKQLLTTIAMQ